MTSSSGSWKKEFVMVEAQLALRVVAMGCQTQVASRKSKAKSIVVASTAGDAPWPWTFPLGPEGLLVLSRSCQLVPAGPAWPASHDAGRKAAQRNPPQHCHNFFGIADASRFKERNPNQRLFTCSYPRADFDISLLMGLCLGNWHSGHRILLLTKHWLPLTPTVGNRPNAPLYALWPTSLVGLDTPRYQQAS